MCNNNSTSWSQIYARRKRAAARFGSIDALPIARRARDIVLASIAPRDRVLEVGAGDRRFAKHLARERSKATYESLDVDLETSHDHRDWSTAQGPFDVIFALEVIEHLNVDAIAPWLAEAARRLSPGGRLVLSTPNIYYPPAYLRDSTHRTPLAHDELAGWVEGSGLEVTALWRTHHEAWLRAIWRRWVWGWLFRLLGLDFARQIVLVARRTEEYPLPK